METDAQQETSWIRQIAAGDRGAFEKLYFAYQKRLFGYLFRVVGEASAAEELTNDVMFEVWKNAGRFRADSRLSTWIFGIAHYRVLNHWRRPRPESVETDEAAAMADTAEGPEQGVLRKDLEGSIQSALSRLSAEHRQIVELTFYEGCSYEEIAEIVRCPVNTVKTRMFHAKKKLQDVLGRMGMRRNEP